MIGQEPLAALAASDNYRGSHAVQRLGNGQGGLAMGRGLRLVTVEITARLPAATPAGPGRPGRPVRRQAAGARAGGPGPGPLRHRVPPARGPD
jgi:hypothetical protein